MMRLPGWEMRLTTVLEFARTQPYELGRHDCLRVACAAVLALTGTDYWPRFRGYRTRRQALATIARIGGSLGEAVAITLGVPPSPTLSALRGDLALFRDGWGEDHLGVVVGRYVQLTLPAGAGSVPLDHPGLVCAWRVG